MNNDEWLQLAATICADAGIAPGSIEVVRTWEDTQNTVYRLAGQRYLKLYHRHARQQFLVEQSALQTLEAGGIPAPRLIVAAAERPELPPYVVMTAIPGVSAELGWDALSRADQLAVAREFGSVTAAYHQLPTQALATVEQEVGGGRQTIAFEREQRLAELEAEPTLPEERHTLYDFSPAQRAELAHFVNVEARAYLEESPVFSHSDLSHAHFLISNATGAWACSGVIDWAGAMVGPAEWDISFLWHWTINRDPDAMKACLQGYFAHAQPPEHFARRCFAAVLHNWEWVSFWSERRGHFAQQPASRPIVRRMVEFLFPPDLFGSPD